LRALVFLDAVPDHDRVAMGRDGTWFYAAGMVHKRLAESHDDEHAKLAVQHTLRALAQGHKRAAFDSGVFAEEGFGTPVNLENAYVVYILGCSARDERAIAKVRELRANNNVSAHFFVALGTAYDGGILTEEKVRGNETLEGLRELYLMFEPPGNHP
jgi:TPR repeat protein